MKSCHFHRHLYQAPWWPYPWLSGLPPCGLAGAHLVAVLFWMWQHSRESAIPGYKAMGQLSISSDKVPPSPVLRLGIFNNCIAFLDQDTGETHTTFVWTENLWMGSFLYPTNSETLKRSLHFDCYVVLACVQVFFKLPTCRALGHRGIRAPF